MTFQITIIDASSSVHRRRHCHACITNANFLFFFFLFQQPRYSLSSFAVYIFTCSAPDCVSAWQSYVYVHMISCSCAICFCSLHLKCPSVQPTYSYKLSSKVEMSMQTLSNVSLCKTYLVRVKKSFKS